MSSEIVYSRKMVLDYEGCTKKHNTGKYRQNTQQIQTSGYLHHLAPLKHLYQKNHDNYMSHFRLELIECANFHPLGLSYRIIQLSW
ncbi:unnamed protein product [Prunus armeniaca]|uniref:Uncharacterized protein n=1 Tax=Prunus armeniaca TaxID=36596 RepID=A0A6J5TVU2_PRUAR|nr:unnamed protein product [Prunus armeniaca]